MFVLVCHRFVKCSQLFYVFFENVARTNVLSTVLVNVFIELPPSYGNLEFRRSYGNFVENICDMELHSTSPLCGNLVDGSPHACHTGTKA